MGQPIQQSFAVQPAPTQKPPYQWVRTFPHQEWLYINNTLVGAYDYDKKIFIPWLGDRWGEAVK